jgi:hypothetical protein
VQERRQWRAWLGPWLAERFTGRGFVRMAQVVTLRKMWDAPAFQWQIEWCERDR